MNEIFSSTLPIFLITLLGAFIKRKWLTAEEFWRGLEKLSYFVLFPSMLFNYTSSVDLNASSIVKLIFALMISSCIVSSTVILYHKKTNCNNIQFTSIFQGSIRYNSYIFLSITGPLLGKTGLAIAAVISSYMIIFTNILSVVAFVHYIPDNSTVRNHKDTIILMVKLMLSNPLIIANIVGFIFNYYEIELYSGIKKTLCSLSDGALAIGMLLVGAGLKLSVHNNKTLLKDILFTSAIKLLAFPIITVIILFLMSITGIDKSVGILYSCLPCASTSYVLSRQLGGDPNSMASIITFTTFFAMASLPILMYFLT